MLSKEEINYKNRYLQQPIISPMLTEENLKLLENHCINSRKNDIGRRFREHEIVLNLLYSYKQLEENNQKLIEKLEETIDFAKTSKDSIDKVKIEVLENVLKIAKGEKECLVYIKKIIN